MMQPGDMGWYEVKGGWLPCKVLSTCCQYIYIQPYHVKKPIRPRVCRDYNVYPWSQVPRGRIFKRGAVMKAYKRQDLCSCGSR